MFCRRCCVSTVAAIATVLQCLYYSSRKVAATTVTATIAITGIASHHSLHTKHQRYCSLTNAAVVTAIAVTTAMVAVAIATAVVAVAITTAVAACGISHNQN